MSLLDNVKKEASHLIKEVDPEFQMIAALLWRDTKAGAPNIAAAAEKIGPKDLNALKDMALQVVANTEKDPTFQNAVGSWKLGHACMILVSQLGKGLLANIPKLGQDTVETLIQTAFAAMVTHA
jgi:hypothetical protein